MSQEFGGRGRAHRPKPKVQSRSLSASSGKSGPHRYHIVLPGKPGACHHISEYNVGEAVGVFPACPLVRGVTRRRQMLRTKKRSVKAEIREMVRRIVRQFHPEKIILFGSHARGNAGPDSDVDLLIVMPVDGSKFDKMVEIGVAIDDIPIPTDVIVTTPEDFEWRSKCVGTIEFPAAREGKVLYARARRQNRHRGRVDA